MRNTRNFAILFALFGSILLVPTLADAQAVTINMIPLKYLDEAQTIPDESTITGAVFGYFENYHVLSISLTSSYEIISSSCSGAGGVIWIKLSEVSYMGCGMQDGELGGVLPDSSNNNACNIDALLRPHGSGTDPGELLPSKANVSSLDIDADTDNDSTSSFRPPSCSAYEDSVEYPEQKDDPDILPGLILGLNDDHDEYLPEVSGVWGRDMDYHNSHALRLARDVPQNANYNACVTPAILKVNIDARKAGLFRFVIITNKVRVFDYSTLLETTGDAAGYHIDKGGWNNVFYVEGVVTGSGYISGQFGPQAPGGGVAYDKVNVTVLNVDLDVDSDNDGADTYSDAEDLIEDKPSLPGMMVPVVDDPDADLFGPSIENLPRGLIHKLSSDWTDLENADIAISPSMVLKKVGGAGDVRVYTDNGTLLFDTAQANGNESSDLYAQIKDHDVHLRIMGLQSGTVELALIARVNPNVVVHVDKVKLTAYKVVMGRILKEGTEYSGDLEIGENYSFEYTLQPSGITVPNLRFVIAHSIGFAGAYTAVHRVDLANVTAGVHTEAWSHTKWTVANVGAYANPNNGQYGAFCVYKPGVNELKISNTKTFNMQLVIETDLTDEKPSADEISSGLYQPRATNQIKVGLKPTSGATIWATGATTWGTQTTENMDGETGDEIKADHIKQVFGANDAASGDYKVVIKGLMDVAENYGPGGEEGVIDDWTIRLR